MPRPEARTPEQLRVTCHADKTLPTRVIKGYGWKPDLPDPRDEAFSPKLAARRHKVPAAPLPPRVDLRESGFMPAVYDQGELGSCTANAIGAAYAYENATDGKRSIMPSRLFIYYAERVMEHTVREDAGAQIRDGMKAIAKLGVPDEQLWPYVEQNFDEKPPKDAYENALTHQCIKYARVDVNALDVKRALAACTPVVLGFTVFESFEDTPSSGVVTPNKGQIIGGHAVLAVGYETAKSKTRVIVRNSWGDAWGDGGYCYFDAAWLCNPKHADDFWAIQTVE